MRYAAMIVVMAIVAMAHGCKCCPMGSTDGDAANADGATPKWTSLFDGKTLGNWQVTEFGGQGEVKVTDGAIILPFGNNATGITWQGEPPLRTNYLLELEAQRVDGTDFFCGLTFPVGDDPCSLIVGGWGGGLVGLSSLDRYDASENETSTWMTFKNKQWYKIRLRVTGKSIAAWIDQEQVINVNIEGREISIRPEVELSAPLGVATWVTTGALRDIRIRKLTDEEIEAADKEAPEPNVLPE